MKRIIINSSSDVKDFLDEILNELTKMLSVVLESYENCKCDNNECCCEKDTDENCTKEEYEQHFDDACCSYKQHFYDECYCKNDTDENCTKEEYEQHFDDVCCCKNDTDNVNIPDDLG